MESAVRVATVRADVRAEGPDLPASSGVAKELDRNMAIFRVEHGAEFEAAHPAPHAGDRTARGNMARRPVSAPSTHQITTRTRTRSSQDALNQKHQRRPIHRQRPI